MDIDAVITWVDGADPAHQKKRMKYQKVPQNGKAPQKLATLDRRFSSSDEIRFCLRSLRNHAPWLRTIWLVTDRQFPRSIDRKSAEAEGIRVVDHKHIFRGAELLLPTFNSYAIESMLWRIDGLAERFLYLNDDFVMTGPMTPGDFFVDEKVVLRGGWSDWSRNEKITFFGETKLNGAKMLGFETSRFFSPAHVIYPMFRSVLDRLFTEFRPEFMRNAAFRFRSRSQFWPISLHNHRVLLDERVTIRSSDDVSGFTIALCREGSREELLSRLTRLSDPDIKLACVNYMEGILERVPEALDILGAATGPAARFEKASGTALPPSSSFRTTFIKPAYRVLKKALRRTQGIVADHR